MREILQHASSHVFSSSSSRWRRMFRPAAAFAFSRHSRLTYIASAGRSNGHVLPSGGSCPYLWNSCTVADDNHRRQWWMNGGRFRWDCVAPRTVPCCKRDLRRPQHPGDRFSGGPTWKLRTINFLVSLEKAERTPLDDRSVFLSLIFIDYVKRM